MRTTFQLFPSLLLGAALTVLSPSAALSQKVVSPKEAAQHVGEIVTVKGVVGGVGHSGRSNTTFVNFGAPFPNHDFTAVIFAAAASQFPNVDSWTGKTVSVTGAVKMYRGKPEIILNSSTQVKVSASP